MSSHIIQLNRTSSDAILKYASPLNGSNSPIYKGSLPISNITVSCDCGTSDNSEQGIAPWIALAFFVMIVLIIFIIIVIAIIQDYSITTASKYIEEARKQPLPSGTLSTNSSPNQESSGDCQPSRGASSHRQNSASNTKPQDPSAHDTKNSHNIAVPTLPRPTTNSTMSCLTNFTGIYSSSTIPGGFSTSPEESDCHSIVFRASPTDIKFLDQALKYLGVDSLKIQIIPMRPDDDSQILYLCPYCPAPLKLKKYGPISYSTSYSKSMSVMEELEVEIEELEKQACAACTRCGTKPANPVPTFDDMPLLNALEADILDLEMRARADCEYCGAVRESIFSHK